MFYRKFCAEVGLDALQIVQPQRWKFCVASTRTGHIRHFISGLLLFTIRTGCDTISDSLNSKGEEILHD